MSAPSYDEVCEWLRARKDARPSSLVGSSERIARSLLTPSREGSSAQLASLIGALRSTPRAGEKAFEPPASGAVEASLFPGRAASRGAARDATPGWLEDGYELLGVLTGGMGELFVCFDQHNGLPFVLKTFRDDVFAGNARLLPAFVKELTFWCGLRPHPNIVRAYGSRMLDDKPHLFLELVCGPTLAEVLREGTLGPPDAVELGLQVCAALQHACSHSVHFVHGDLKPSNLLLAGEQAKLTDFGLARTAGVGGPDRASGTPPYMAPELWRGEEVTEKADVYALGVLLWEALAGRRPFPGKDLRALRAAHLEQAPPPVRLPREWSPLGFTLLSCLAKNPAERPPVEELAKALGSLRKTSDTRRFRTSSGTFQRLRKAVQRWLPERQVVLPELGSQPSSGVEATIRARLVRVLSQPLDARGLDALCALSRLRGRHARAFGELPPLASKVPAALEERADLRELYLPRGDFSGRRLRGSNLLGADLRESRWREAQLLRVSLRDADLRGADLREAALVEVDLQGADLRKARLAGLDLRRCSLPRALEGADLRGTRLDGCDLQGARLTDADVREARLAGADLRRADLRGARLEGVDLATARLTGANLRGALIDPATTLPADVAADRLGPDPLLGTLLAGRFFVKRRLARNEVGALYRVVDEQGAEHALRWVPTGRYLRSYPTRRTLTHKDAVRRPLGALLSLRHPRLVPLHEAGMCAEGSFLTMEHVHGSSFATRIASGPVEVDRALAWTRRLLEGLAVLHGNSIAHLCLSPRTVLLGEGGVRLAGLGCGPLFQWADRPPYYLAPEQLIGQGTGPRSDVFSVGVILWELLAGRVFESRKRRFAPSLFDPVPDLSLPALDSRDRLRGLLARMLEVDPTRRPASARHALEGLARI